MCRCHSRVGVARPPGVQTYGAPPLLSENRLPVAHDAVVMGLPAPAVQLGEKLVGERGTQAFLVEELGQFRLSPNLSANLPDFLPVVVVVDARYPSVGGPSPPQLARLTH